MLSTILLLLKLLIFFTLINESNCVLCPPPSTTPCICNTTLKEISCRGGFIDLEEVFDEFAKLIPENERDFDAFYLNSRGLTTLKANTFKGIRFRVIILGGSKLTYLHNEAFLGTQMHTEELLAFATNLSIGNSEHNLFDSISSLTNLQRLVISGSNITRIPDRAFIPRNGLNTQRSLSEIELGLGVRASIESIGSSAFGNLPGLKSLSFSGHRINHIKFGAFSFDESSNKTLTIDLTSNNLNDSSFEIGSLLGSNRPVKIHLGLGGCNNNMTFLNKAIFEPFFEENQLNSVDIGRSCRHMICDCRMDWILNKNYIQRVRNLKCRDGLSFRESKDRFDEKISKCKSDVDTDNIIKPMIEDLEEVISEVFGNNQDSGSQNNEKSNLCLTDVCAKTALEISDYLNTSINPCDNFYEFSCGKWQESHRNDYLMQLLSNGGVEYDNFVRLRHQVDKNLDLILSQNIRTDQLSITKETFNMYKACKENKSPDIDELMDYVNQIAEWPIVSGLSDGYRWQDSLVLMFSNIRKDVLITLDSVINADSVVQLKITHSSFVLSRFRLLDITSRSSLRDVASYAKYIHDVAVLLGAQQSYITNNDTFDAALDIIKFESELAKISEKSDGREFLIERNLKSLKCLIPEIDWIEIFTNVLENHDINLDDFSQTNVIFDLHYLIRISMLLRKTDPIIIANYLGWRLVETLGYLMGGTQFLDHQQSFHSIQSNEKTKELWFQCLAPLKKHLPYILTRKYAELYLTESEKVEVIEIVKSVKHSFIELVNQKEWLGDSQKGFIEKTESIKENVGYPDWIFDENKFKAYHQNLTMKLNGNETAMGYYIKVSIYSTEQFLLSIGKKVDKTEVWDQSPLSVGASYDIIDNIITIPIGLLHPPFYDSRRPAYLNYGSIGSFVGHEISHSSIPRYDLDENLLEPWNETLMKTFISKAKCFVDQYSAYYDEQSDMNLDGLRTFEEDIGDIAGLKASLNAYESYIKQTENKIDSEIKLLPTIPQYSAQQLFFMSYAQKWCRHITRSQVRTKILRGVHSPEMYRVNGALSNFDQFSKAFDCPSGSVMNPENKCEMW